MLTPSCSEDGYFIFWYSRLQLDISLDKWYIKKEKSGHHLQFEILRTPLGGHIIFFGGKQPQKTPATKPLASFQVLPWWRFALLFHQRASLNASCQGSPKVVVVTQTSRGNKKITRKITLPWEPTNISKHIPMSMIFFELSEKIGICDGSWRKCCLVPMNCPFHFKVILKVRGVDGTKTTTPAPYVCHFDMPTLLTPKLWKVRFHFITTTELSVLGELSDA